jgi:Na+/H+-dicarboxylate symporter
MKKRVHLYTFLAMALGILFGIFSTAWIETMANQIAELFINGLKMLSLPIIFLSIVSTITGMKKPSEAGALATKVLKYTLITTVLAATIGLAIFLLISPQTSSSSIAEAQSVDLGQTYLNFVKKIIPSNIVEPFLENNVLGVAFIATLMSLALLKIGSKERETASNFFSALFQAMLKVSSWVITILPIGIFAFTIQFILSMKSGKDMEKVGYYALSVVAANLVQGLIVLPIMLKRKGISPTNAFKAMLPALTVAFFSKSSNAALPLTLECSQKQLGVSPQTAKFSLPLCSVINMNGCAAFILITTLFVSMSEGITFSLWQMALWIPIATLVAIGNAGVPMGCFFLTSALLVGMNVPLHLMGLILPLYTIIDMIETALNVWSDSCVTATVDKELRDREVIA